MLERGEQKVDAARRSGATTLSLSGLQLTALPDSIGGLTKLTRLNLGGNQLTTLPDSIGGLTNLTRLNLGGNQFESLPETVSRLRGIIELNVGGNRLTVLPEWIGLLARLTELNVGGNRLSTLPTSIHALTNLRKLTLHSNQLTTLPESIGQLTNLAELNVGGNQLSTLPSTMVRLADLARLNAGGNQLSALPAWIGQLSALTDLVLGGNRLEALPESIGRLTGLARLLLGGNRLRELPTSLGELTDLTELNLHGNQLATLPESIDRLTDLARLNLSNNGLSDVPEPICRLTNLAELNLQGNQLTALPESIDRLTNLARLNLSNNHLSALPESMSRLTNLTELKVAQNPLPPTLLAVSERQGPRGVRMLLADQASGMAIPEAKVLVLGEGEVGKTSLVARLAGKGFVDRPRTHGIELERAACDTDDGPLSLRFWDFGGQDVYRVTHQFFFTPNTLYIIVFRAREGIERGDVEGWLDRVRLRIGPSAKVMIVATHCDQHSPDVDLSYLSEVFGAPLVGSYSVDNKSGTGIDVLRDAIVDEALDLPHIRETYPLSYSRFLEELDELADERPQIDWREFVEIAGRHGLDSIQAESAAITLSLLGRATYFTDHVSLSGRVVLKPDWLTTAISYVLTDEETLRNGGEIHDDRLLALWTDPTPTAAPDVAPPTRFDRSDFGYLTELMLLYGVSFPLTDRPAHIIAQMLPTAEPDDLGIPDEVLARGEVRRIVVEMGNRAELPGLIPWLTVRNQPFRTESRWRRGAVLFHPDDRSWALFRMPARNRIELTVWGEHPDAFFQTQRASLDAALGQWLALDRETHVSCPTRLTSLAGTANEFGLCEGSWPLRDLHVFAEEGDTEVRCPKCRAKHQIAVLLARPRGNVDQSLVLDAVRRLSKQVDSLRRDSARAQDATRAGLAAIAGRQDDAIDSIRELADRLQFDSDLLLRVSMAQRSETPRLVSFEPADRSAWNPKQWFSQRYEMRLWCEYPGHQHPSGPPYSFSQPHDWWRSAGPYLRWVSIVLSIAPVVSRALAVAGDHLPSGDRSSAASASTTTDRGDDPVNPASGAHQAFGREDLARIRRTVDFTTALADLVVQPADPRVLGRGAPAKHPTDLRLDQVEMRVVSELITDLASPEMGGLRLTMPSPAEIRDNPAASITPDGYGRWLCDHHHRIIVPEATTLPPTTTAT